MQIAFDFLSSKVRDVTNGVQILPKTGIAETRQALRRDLACRTWFLVIRLSSSLSCTKCGFGSIQGRSETTLAGMEALALIPQPFNTLVGRLHMIVTAPLQPVLCSRFEHVFVGESKNGEISGLHNWLQFFNLEQRRELDYRGYIFPKRM